MSLGNIDFYRLSNQELAEIVSDYNYSIGQRCSAVSYIRCPDMLKSLAEESSNRTVLKTIFEYLANEKEFFVDFSKNHPDWQIRLMAISYVFHDYNFDRDCERILSSNEYGEFVFTPNLEEIALEDEDYKSRLVAALLISDPKILNEIALNDENSHVRIAAISQIDDEDMLCEIIRKNRNGRVIEFASSKIKSDSKLIELYKSNISVYHNRNVISNIHNQAFLIKEVYQNSFDWTLCRNAVSNIHSQWVLCEIIDHYAKPDFEEPKDEFISYSDDYTYLGDFIRHAIGLLFDDRLLFRLVFDHDGLDLSQYVSEQILNPSILTDIALNYPINMSMRDFLQITDEDSLFEIALNHPIEDTRAYAASRIFKKDLLVKIIEAEPADRVKSEALKNLKLEEEDFTLESDNEYVIGEVLKTVDDDLLLRDMFNRHRHAIVKQIACERIGDENILKELACANYIFPACLAINNIESDEILADVAMNACFENTRIYAISKITDNSLLKHIFENSDSYACRINALSQISDEEYLADVANDLLAESLKRQ